MKIIKTEKRLCFVCMEEHEVKTVRVTDIEEFKGEEVSFESTYEYCDDDDEFIESEEMIRSNSLAMKDAYREKVGLLTSKDIINIRDKYNVSQKNFSRVLGWGRSTVTRYENHHVQDRAHDDILRKINSDPKWYIEMLIRAKENISEKAYEVSYKAAREAFEKKHNEYLIDYIESLYAQFIDDKITGGVNLNLNKVVEMINYFASKVSSLHKVKLMKMLWYADSVSYKRKGKSISGLVYNALPMGAVPEGYDQIVDLDGVQYETVSYDEEYTGYKFYPVEGFEIKELTSDEVEVLDTVIAEVGHFNSRGIIDKMHDEEAYKCTDSNCVIPFSFAEQLSID